jgi:hypothetical protein
MRLTIIAVTALSSFAAAMPASAATIVILTEPSTLERRVVVVDPKGPDRAYMCMLPPGTAGCQAVPFKRLQP